jgi:hypothetical protein
MKKLAITAAIAASLLAPSLVRAEDSMMMKPAPMYVCHAAAASATPNAMMGSAGLTCVKVDGAKMHMAVTKVQAMEPSMDAATKAQVIQLLKMITTSMSGGVYSG